jgi:dishevelled associated activator of morphogenesis
MGPPPPPGGGAALPKISVPKPSVPMKNINWVKIPNSKIKDTVFAQLGKEKMDQKLDFKEIESLFCKKIIQKKETSGMHTRLYCTSRLMYQ